MEKTEEKKPNGNIIEEQFFELRAYVGLSLKFINEVALTIGGPDIQDGLQRMVALMTGEALKDFNTSVSEIAEKFDNLEYEPVFVESDVIVPLGD